MKNPKLQYHDLSRNGFYTGQGFTKQAFATVMESCGWSANVDPGSRYAGDRRIEALKRFSITTLEEAVGAAYAVPKRLAEIIGAQNVDLLRSEGFRKEACVAFPALDRFPKLAERKLSFGARLGAIGNNYAPRVNVETGSATPSYVSEHSLVENRCMPSIRDQGQRWTCVAFATCAVVEYAHCRDKNLNFDASEQFQYWDTKRNDPDGYNTLGTYPEISFSRVVSAGVCREETWSYNKFSDPPEADPKGPASVNEALYYRVRQSVKISQHQNITTFKNYLREGSPVAIAIPVFDSWASNPAVYDSGNIGMPLPGETSNYGHALVLVGFGDDANFPGGGFFIIRNSYGTAWGAQCPFGAGYGTIPYKYIEDHNYSAFIVRL